MVWIFGVTLLTWQFLSTFFSAYPLGLEESQKEVDLN